MKARFIENWGVELEAETAYEENLLNHFNAEGIRVSSHGPKTMTICSPKMANLKQLHLNQNQQLLLAYVLAADADVFLGEGATFSKNLKKLKYQLLDELITPVELVLTLPPLPQPNSRFFALSEGYTGALTSVPWHQDWVEGKGFTLPNEGCPTCSALPSGYRYDFNREIVLLTDGVHTWKPQTPISMSIFDEPHPTKVDYLCPNCGRNAYGSHICKKLDGDT